MKGTLVKALIASVPTTLLFAWSLALALRKRTIWAWLQAAGAVGLIVVVVTHICEALNLLPWMHWGEPDSVGHYLDLASGVLGLVFVAVGYLADRFSPQRS